MREFNLTETETTSKGRTRGEFSSLPPDIISAVTETFHVVQAETALKDEALEETIREQSQDARYLTQRIMEIKLLEAPIELEKQLLTETQREAARLQDLINHWTDHLSCSYRLLLRAKRNLLDMRNYNNPNYPASQSTQVLYYQKLSIKDPNKPASDEYLESNKEHWQEVLDNSTKAIEVSKKQIQKLAQQKLALTNP